MFAQSPVRRKGAASAVLLSLALLPAGHVALAAKVSSEGGLSVNYTQDDNISVSPLNEISLAGFEADGYVDLVYEEERLKVFGRLDLGIDRYQDADLSTDDDNLEEPEASDFDNENYGAHAEVDYDWERHTLGISASARRDSILSTDFLDTGFGLRELQENSQVDKYSIIPSWQWQATERQQVYVGLNALEVDYQSGRYVDYSYLSSLMNWSYGLSAEVAVQARVSFSNFKNEAELSVKSDSYNLQGGMIWDISETWLLDALIGATRVSTQYGLDGFLTIDPETNLPEFVELDDEDSEGFSGDTTLTYQGGSQVLSVNLSSAAMPTGNGELQYQNRGRISYSWRQSERVRLEADLVIGESESTDDRVSNKREYAQSGVRISYQFREQWWASAAYRYRESENTSSNQRRARSNLFLLSVSYRLPETIF